jgi:hypothetical protein
MRFLLPSHKPEENTMPNIPTPPLHQLTAWKDNIRKTQNKGFIDELTASIKTPGYNLFRIERIGQCRCCFLS